MLLDHIEIQNIYYDEFLFSFNISYEYSVYPKKTGIFIDDSVINGKKFRLTQINQLHLLIKWKIAFQSGAFKFRFVSSFTKNAIKVVPIFVCLKFCKFHINDFRINVHT